MRATGARNSQGQQYNLGPNGEGYQYDPNTGQGDEVQVDFFLSPGSVFAPPYLRGVINQVANQNSRVRLGDLFNYGPDSLIRRMARYNNQNPAQARSMIQFADAMVYGVGYPAAAAVAAPVVGAGLSAGGAAYLANPETVVFVTAFGTQFTSPSGPNATLPQYSAYVLNQTANFLAPYFGIQPFGP